MSKQQLFSSSKDHSVLQRKGVFLFTHHVNTRERSQDVSGLCSERTHTVGAETKGSGFAKITGKLKVNIPSWCKLTSTMQDLIIMLLQAFNAFAKAKLI